MENHSGKVVLVTGGSRGIGEGIVRHLCSEGAHVHATYNSGSDRATAITAEIHQAGGNVHFHKVNVADEEAVNTLVDTIVQQHGALHGVVNNAGITRDGLILRMQTKDWSDVLSTNLTGAFFVCRAAAKVMVRQKNGRIVNVGSIVGLAGNAGQVNYSASKAGLVGLTRSLARELASRNVLVNCLAPGFVETEMTDKLSEEQKAAYYESIPLKRPATTQDIACVVSFLLGESSAYITGQVLNVDGGLVM